MKSFHMTCWSRFLLVWDDFVDIFKVLDTVDWNLEWPVVGGHSKFIKISQNGPHSKYIQVVLEKRLVILSFCPTV